MPAGSRTIVRRILHRIPAPCMPAAPAIADATTPSPIAPSPTAQFAAVAGGAATAIGLIAHGTWRALPAERFALSLVLATVALALAWPLRRCLRWSQASALAVVWLVALAVFVGPWPVLATMLLALAALSIGLWLTPTGLAARAAIATIVGLLAIAMTTGWTLTLPIHHPWVWLALLSSIVLVQRRAVAATLRDTAAGWRAAVDAAPRAAACAVMLLGIASVACWLPTLQSDDLGYHLGLPTQLLQHARYAPDAEYQVWAYAPWAGDALHGIAFVLSRRDAHGAVNALWLALIAGALWALLTPLRASVLERWAAVALFASFPPLVWMAAGLQTELASIATLCAFVALSLALPACIGSRRALFAGAVLFAGLFALKLVHGVAALPLLVWALWTQRAHLPLRWLPVASILGALLMASSHVHAWLATGNPVLPMFNHVFGSPYFPHEQFSDPRWHAGFGPDILWRVTFLTDRYVEGWNGGLGFGLIALAGLWLLRLAQPGRRALFVAATACLLLPLVPMQYARYAWPGIVLLLALLVAGSESLLGRRMFVWCFAGLCALNLAYQANASWLHHAAVVKRTLRSGGDADAVLPSYAAERLLIRRIPTRADARIDTYVLAADPTRNMVAELAGRGRTVSMHDPSLHAEAKIADGDASGARWAALFARERIGWVLVNGERASPALRAGLAAVGATRTDALHGIELWRLAVATAVESRP